MIGRFRPVSGILLLPVFALLLHLAGCATASISMSKDELQNMRIERIDVVYAPDAVISWDREETAYFAAVKAKAEKPKPWKQVMAEDVEAAKNEYQRVLNTPEAKAHLQAKLTDELRRRLTERVLPNFQGTRPVALQVMVQGFSIPSAAQRVILGGGPVFGAVTTIRDAKTGAELAKLDRMAAGYAGNGVLGVLADQALSDLEDRVLDAYNQQVMDWLKAA